MALDGATLIQKLRSELQDVDMDRWSLSELADALNQAADEVAIQRHDLFARTVEHKLQAGPRQTLPEGCFRLVEAIGNTGGGPISLVESRRELDVSAPGWMTAPGRERIRHYIYDLRDPTHFFVWPPADGVKASLDLVVVAYPQRIAADGTGAIDLADVYESALLKGGIWKAYAKDAEYAGNAQIMQLAYSAFASTLTGDIRASVVSSPNGTGVGNKADISASTR